MVLPIFYLMLYTLLHFKSFMRSVEMYFYNSYLLIDLQNQL
ncbi:hypothetical protein RG47T_2694 [Mucilaginibacter polytrichastri]|uniref:Uncharacterized protein n=1 Tax=Mucilaginibacter polytrichastri TaxID=1302689 RepID=A0A1Q5ZZN5_9SPHI|nr:hypothetical protein RG47T_2694 [Mucilaginibacter polytrichastri]